MPSMHQGVPVSWYLRSIGDRDTHRGQWSGVTRSVHSLCGLEFAPVALPLDLIVNLLDAGRHAAPYQI